MSWLPLGIESDGCLAVIMSTARPRSSPPSAQSDWPVITSLPGAGTAA